MKKLLAFVTLGLMLMMSACAGRMHLRVLL